MTGTNVFTTNEHPAFVALPKSGPANTWLDLPPPICSKMGLLCSHYHEPLRDAGSCFPSAGASAPQKRVNPWEENHMHKHVALAALLAAIIAAPPALALKA